MRHAYLVVERDPLVASDLQEIILEHDALASITTLGSVKDAVEFLAAKLAIEATVVAVCPTEHVAKSGLDVAVQAAQSHLVLVNPEEHTALNSATDWRHVTAPYTTETLLDALRDLSALRRSPGLHSV